MRIAGPGSRPSPDSTFRRDAPHPTAERTAQPLREAFPRGSAPRILLRDRDRIFGSDFTKQVKELDIQEVLGAPGVPQQRAYIERVIGAHSPRVSGPCNHCR